MPSRPSGVIGAFGSSREIKVGEIIAYRVWIVRHNMPLRLMSFNRTVWPVTMAIHADKPPFTVAKGYGVHAFKDPKRAQNYHGHVWGSIEMWGQIEEHALGYRSEFARVSAIIGFCQRKTRPLYSLWHSDALLTEELLYQLQKLYHRKPVNAPRRHDKLSKAERKKREVEEQRERIRQEWLNKIGDIEAAKQERNKPWW